MRIDVEKHNGIAIVKVTGDIKFTTCSDFVQQITNLLNQGNKQMLISWEDVDYFDSSALGALITIRRQFDKVPGAQLAVYTPHEEHINVFKKINLQSFFRITNDMSTALEFFTKDTVMVE